MVRYNDISLGDAIKAWIRDSGLEESIFQSKIASLWDQLMGGPISKHTKSIILKDTKLFITVDNPALKNELHFSKSKIKEMLNRELKESIISEVFIY
jgi:predicted nucleic acid-binding Zn ribbon protein